MEEFLNNRIRDACEHRRRAILKQLKYGTLKGAFETARAYSSLIKYLRLKLAEQNNRSQEMEQIKVKLMDKLNSKKESLALLVVIIVGAIYFAQKIH
jgi:hypothetical protein